MGWVGSIPGECIFSISNRLKAVGMDVTPSHCRVNLESDRDQGIIGPKEPLTNETLKSPREWIVYTRRKKRAN